MLLRFNKTIGSSTAFTVIVTVAEELLPELSVTVNVKVSVPLKLAAGIYVATFVLALKVTDPP